MINDEELVLHNPLGLPEEPVEGEITKEQLELIGKQIEKDLEVERKQYGNFTKDEIQEYIESNQ